MTIDETETAACSRTVRNGITHREFARAPRLADFDCRERIRGIGRWAKHSL